MEKLKDRYFIRLYEEGSSEATQLPLASARTLFRVFIHFVSGSYVSLEVFREDYFGKRVCNVAENASGITTAVRTSMRQKVLKSPIYDDLANKFSEGLYDPEDNGVYENEVMKIKAFNQKQFDDVVELLAIINDEGSL